MTEDWIDTLFAVVREEAVSISADFGDRVKHRIDLVADAQGILPPSATSLLVSVSVETGNMVASAIAPQPSEDDATDDELSRTPDASEE